MPFRQNKNNMVCKIRITPGLVALLLLVNIFMGCTAEFQETLNTLSPAPSPSPTPTVRPTASPTPRPTPTPTPTPEPYPDLAVISPLEPGDEGDEVTALQQMLVLMGFGSPSTGVYDCRTRNAIRAFERYAGCEADGLLDREAVDALNALYNEARGKPVNRDILPLEGYVVCVDAGHQAHLNSGQEPVSPGSKTTKAKVSGGTRGIVTKLYEYELNLLVALKLRDSLEAMGAEVVMVRETHDVNISNAERAGMANDADADLFFRIHANGNNDRSKSGMFMLVPAVRGCQDEALAQASLQAAHCILDATVAATGAKHCGYSTRSDISGFNWSQVPVCLIEMGFMTNADEDQLMATDEYQNLLAQGMAEGIADYLLSAGEPDPTAETPTPTPQAVTDSD